ncbi:MAG: oligosaccharide flippase family protein [Candidatus Eisenbacteria bacterium]|nr:oligosaccharide flippase family protein [Candidatus Eisenbacteria bacterium]
MTEAGRLTRNVLYGASTHGTNFLVLLLFILAARVLGDEDFGKFSYAFALVTAFMQLSLYSMHNRTIIDVARDPSRVPRVFGNLLGMQLIASALTIALVTAIGFLIDPRPEIRLLVFLLAVAMVSRGIKMAVRLLLKGLERFGVEAIVQLAGQGGLFAVCLFALLASGDLVLFTVVFAAARLLDALLVHLWALRGVGGVRPRFDWASWPPLLRAGILFAGVNAVRDVYFRIGTVALGLIRTDAEVGWYNAATKLYDVTQEIPVVLAYALLPTLSAVAILPGDRLARLYRRGFRYLLAAGLPLTLYFFLTAPRLIGTIYGSEYGPAAGMLRLLALAVFPSFLVVFGAYVLMALDRVRAVLVLSATTTAVACALNPILIASHGGAGAAAALLLTQIFGALWMSILIARAGQAPPRWGGLLPILAAALPTAAVIRLLAERSVLLSAPTAAAVYVLFLLLLRVPDEQERGVIRSVLRVLLRRSPRGDSLDEKGPDG